MEAFGDKWPRWRQLTSTAAHRGMLCFGPDRGRKMTYTNPHRWLPGLRPADCDAALHTLITRYLHAYRPATPQRRRQLQRGQLRPAGFQRAQDPDNPHPASRPGAAAALLAQLSRPPCPIAARMPGQGPPLPGRRSNEPHRQAPQRPAPGNHHDPWAQRRATANPLPAQPDHASLAGDHPRWPCGHPAGPASRRPGPRYGTRTLNGLSGRLQTPRTGSPARHNDLFCAPHLASTEQSPGIQIEAFVSRAFPGFLRSWCRTCACAGGS
jgi:Winged helix DNA-binding domain